MNSSPSSVTPFKNNSSGLSIVLLVGLSCIGLGGYLFYDAWNVQGRSQQAIGTIARVDSRYASGSRGGQGYAPEVTFTTASDQIITFINPVYSTRFSQRAGETVIVHYSSDNPQDARIRMPADSFAFWSIIFGSFFFLLGIIGRRQMKAAE